MGLWKTYVRLLKNRPSFQTCWCRQSFVLVVLIFIFFKEFFSFPIRWCRGWGCLRRVCICAGSGGFPVSTCSYPSDLLVFRVFLWWWLLFNFSILFGVRLSWWLLWLTFCFHWGSCWRPPYPLQAFFQLFLVLCGGGVWGLRINWFFIFCDR